MAVGKRIYLKRHMPDKEVMMQFKNIPASNTCDVMGRNAAMNPRIRLVSQPKEQMADRHSPLRQEAVTTLLFTQH